MIIYHSISFVIAGYRKWWFFMACQTGPSKRPDEAWSLQESE